VNNLPLAGVRVADFGQIIAIPFTAQVLAWLGAEVILVESRQRLTTRVWPPFADAVPGVNRSGGFNLVNTGKLSCTLNLREEEGVDLARRIIAISDVVMENFSTGTMDRLGLGYETARQLRPDIVYLSLGAFGRTGPMMNLVGFHSVINLFSGLAAVTGYPGGHPRILGAIFPDVFSGCYCLLALLEALYHRSTTGQGQFIEVAMTEALTTLLPEAVMNYTLNGKEEGTVGNRHAAKAPHNVFRCKGEQKWVAISVATDSQWESLAQAMDHPEWVRDPRFADGAGRLAHLDDLDTVIESWTREREPSEAVAVLQRAGVAAAPVLDSAEVLRDPHLVDRQFITQVDHPETGRRPMGTVSWSFDGERAVRVGRSPLLGEHNGYVLRELLDLSEADLQRLTEAGVID